jgi:hypothetical protein
MLARLLPQERPSMASDSKSFALVALIATLLSPQLAAAAEPGDAVKEAPDAVPEDLPRLVLDTGRTAVAPPEKDLIRFQLHGEYQVRYEHLRSFPLDVSTRVANDKPGAVEDTLGQRNFFSHWLRLTPRLQIRDNIEVIGQFDAVSGLVIGELAHDSHADETARNEYDGFKNVQARWLYAEIKTQVGLFRVGQQPSHWGMGLLANDGDHPTLFGDYRYGSIVERLLYATRPGGKDSPIAVVVAGDLVYRDQLAQLSRGDQAFQGVLAALYDKGPNQIGLYGVWRQQVNDKTSGSQFFTYTDRLNLGILDVSGKFAVPVAGTPDTFVFGAAEAALVFGSTNLVRTADQSKDDSATTVRAFGGAARLGVVRRAYAPVTKTYGVPDPVTFGDVLGQVEVGYASGDADPYDGTEKRFTFNPNYKVGLVLFDEVMRWQTARAATAAMDPLLQNGSRPTPGTDLLPSNGGVFGAQYINPTMLVRPRRWLDLKAGMVLAQTTADYVDPYRVAVQGAYTNYRGGEPRRHDLGVELDAGVEARIPLEYKMTLALGAQGGVLFPGGALANDVGQTMKAPWLAIGRLGLLF